MQTSASPAAVAARLACEASVALGALLRAELPTLQEAAAAHLRSLDHDGAPCRVNLCASAEFQTAC